MMGEKLEVRLWSQLRQAWLESDPQALAELGQSFALCAPLPLAWAMLSHFSAQIRGQEREAFIAWLLERASSEPQIFWLHLLGLFAWETGAPPCRPESELLALLAGPFEHWLSLSEHAARFATADMAEQVELLEAAYLDWDKRVGRKPSAWLRAFCLHAIARATAGCASQDATVRAFARPLLVVLLRRLSDDPEGAAQQFEALEAVDWAAHAVGARYLAVLERYRAYSHLARDRHRADQARQLYFQRIALARDPGQVLQERINAYLRANELRLASLQGLVRVPGFEAERLSYRLLNQPTEAEPSFAGLGIYGWHGEPGQWQSYLSLGKTYRARQAAYQEALASYWQQVDMRGLERLYPDERYETVWIAGSDMAFYGLCEQLLGDGADAGAILAECGLDRAGKAMEGLLDSLERLLNRVRSHRTTLSWPKQLEPLALVAWVLADGLFAAPEPVRRLRRNAERLCRRELPPEVPQILLAHLRWYQDLTPSHWRAAVPWPLYRDEQLLGPIDRPYVCFVHPLGYERLEQGTSRVPAALICGRFYLPEANQTPFVAGSFRHYLQPVIELCRHLIDLAIHQQRKDYAVRLSAQAVELAAVKESQARFRRIQEQMRAFDRAKQELDSLWHGISHALTPPAYAAYGILDWQRLLDVFDDGKSIRGVKGAHNLASVTARQLDVFLAHLTEGQIVSDTFIGHLQRCWSQLDSPTDLQARCYFALLKLVALDGFARGKPLALVQLLVALRLAMPRPGLSLFFASESNHACQDLSWLLSADDCPHERFLAGLGQLSGFDFARGAYTLSTPSSQALPLASGLAGEVCQRLTQLLIEELYRPEQARWLRLTRVDALWRTSSQGDCALLWLECDKSFEPSLPELLAPGEDDLPHGLRDCLERLRLACGAEHISFGEAESRLAIADEPGLGFWNLRHEQRCLIRWQLGAAAPGAAALNLSLDNWRQRWQAGSLRPDGI